MTGYFSDKDIRRNCFLDSLSEGVFGSSIPQKPRQIGRDTSSAVVVKDHLGSNGCLALDDDFRTVELTSIQRCLNLTYCTFSLTRP